MAVNINKARGYCKSCGVDVQPRGLLYLAEGDDASIADGEILLEGCGSRAVVHRTAANQYVQAHSATAEVSTLRPGVEGRCIGWNTESAMRSYRI